MENLNRTRTSASDVIYGYLRIFVGLIAIVGAISGTALYFLPIEEVDLTVRIAENSTLRIPRNIDDPNLVLLYDESEISAASFLTLEIQNTGFEPIGEDQDWVLSFDSQEQVDLLIQDGISSHPPNLGVEILGQDDDDFPGLLIKLFNPGDRIMVELLAINPPSSEISLIAATRVPRLSTPLVTTLTLEERFQNAYYQPLTRLIWFMSLVIVTIIWFERTRNERPQYRWQKGLSIAIYWFAVTGIVHLVLLDDLIRIIMAIYGK